MGADFISRYLRGLFSWKSGLPGRSWTEQPTAMSPESRFRKQPPTRTATGSALKVKASEINLLTSRMPYNEKALILLGFSAVWWSHGGHRNYMLSVIFFNDPRSVWV